MSWQAPIWTLNLVQVVLKRLNHTLARMTLWPETLWPGHFGQNDTLARVTLWPVTLWPETLWPERHFGQWLFGWWHFGQWHFGQSDTLASDTLARVTLWPETLWPEWHFGQFFLLPLGYQRVNKNSMWGTIGKNLKKIIITFQKTRLKMNFNPWPRAKAIKASFFQMLLSHFTEFFEAIWHNFVISPISQC